MNNIISIKRYTPNADPIFPVAKKKFIELATKLKKKNLIKKYDLQDVDGLKLILYRQLDNKQVTLEITDSGEVFWQIFDRAYECYFTSAYEMKDKLEALDNLLYFAPLWVEKNDYYEEFYEQNGKVIFRRIVFPNGGSESASVVHFGWLRRFFGCKKRIVRP
ncbi:MAG: hypothetical protein AAB583_00810 [Patescibacteria group bacterium]